MRAKLLFFHVSKWIGLFALAARLNRGKLPILCYHGFSINDESEFRPKLFMSRKSFQARMHYLWRRGYQVLPLEEAVRRLGTGDLPKRAVAITIDDGFYSVYLHAMPVLRQYSFPATLYLSTYYVEKGTPVFRLAIQYMFWKTNRPSCDLSKVIAGGEMNVDLTNRSERLRVTWDLIEYGEAHCDEPERCALSARLADELNVDYKELVGRRGLSMITPAELRSLVENGIDIQLHTHRHRFPENRDIVQMELADNKRFLQQFSEKPLRHFCYPSGVWSKAHWPWLSEFGILTATTCESGLNLPSTPLWGLKRFLDGERVSQIEFEAELCGFTQVLREINSLFNRNKSSQPATTMVPPESKDSPAEERARSMLA